MDDCKFLSYTHGHILQAVLKELIDHIDDEASKPDCLGWVKEEKRNLLKKQPKLWEIPVSTRAYFDYLMKLEELLSGDENVSELEMLLGEVKDKTREKIHTVFLTQEPSCWPSIESVFRAAQASEDVEASLVYTPFYHVNFLDQFDYYDDYQAMGLPVLRHYEYDLPGDSPDVVFMIKPYGNTPDPYQFRELETVVPRAIFVPYGMEITVDLAKTGFQYYLQYKAWRHCAYGPIVKEYGTQYGYRKGENIVVWGHPKADLYRDLDAGRDSIPEEWKTFINGRKVILWTPHHLIELDSNGTGTWLIWGEKILKLAFDNPDIVFIIRPHPLMVGALINSKAMTQGRYDRIRKKIDASPNIIWDDSSDYRAAFYASDAIITDG
ncbi:MAG: CDP-glycerol glycerophosphotransferase family protein, partial [Lachnospiraceae bacterium]|nr:CDP-glycerol glycerophosphotransferase family protein [Lachnospiraceae bacterium]